QQEEKLKAEIAALEKVQGEKQAASSKEEGETQARLIALKSEVEALNQRKIALDKDVPALAQQEEKLKAEIAALEKVQGDKQAASLKEESEAQAKLKALRTEVETLNQRKIALDKDMPA